MEKVTIGNERVSITLIYKTRGDLIVSQHSSERWFETPQDARDALRSALDALLVPTDGGFMEGAVKKTQS